MIIVHAVPIYGWHMQTRTGTISNCYAYDFLYLDICVISSLSLTGTASNYSQRCIGWVSKGQLKCLPTLDTECR